MSAIAMLEEGTKCEELTVETGIDCEESTVEAIEDASRTWN